ncbi:MAG: hypothetical protein AB1938_12520, partial [Myxococcota bacterium]
FELEAQLHLRAGAYDQAEQAAKKAVDRGLTPHRALLRAEALRRLGRADEALELLRQDAGAVPETTLAWKAELLARLNHRDEAEALLAGLDAGALAVHRARCLIHVQAGELQMAEAACALADPSELDVAWAIALLDLRAGRPEKARAIAEAELARRRTRMALTLLAGVRIVEGDPAEAQRLADEVRDGGATDLELAELDALLKWTRDAGR